MLFYKLLSVYTAEIRLHTMICSYLQESFKNQKNAQTFLLFLAFYNMICHCQNHAIFMPRFSSTKESYLSCVFKYENVLHILRVYPQIKLDA